MRLLLVVPNVVGFRSFLIELSSVLVEKGVEVHCACSQNALWDYGEKPVRLPARMHDIPFARGMNPVEHLKTSRQLDSLVSSICPDIVHAHFSAAIFTTALAKRHHWPVTTGTFQGVSFLLMSGVKAQLIKIAETWASSRLDEVWVLSDDDYVGLRSTVPGSKVKRQLSYGFGCDLDKFNPAKISLVDREVLLSQLGLTADHYIFTFVGRFVFFKGFDITVRAFVKLAQTRPDARLLLIGRRDRIHPTGLTPDEERALKNSSQIIDLGPQTEVQRYLAITQTMVFPSKREGMPVCLMEALAMGVPVITRDARGCQEVVRDQIDGLVLQNCTVDTLVAAMKLVADNETLRQRFAAQALAGRERFSRLNYIREQVQIYERLYAETR